MLVCCWSCQSLSRHSRVPSMRWAKLYGSIMTKRFTTGPKEEIRMSRMPMFINSTHRPPPRQRVTRLDNSGGRFDKLFSCDDLLFFLPPPPSTHRPLAPAAQRCTDRRQTPSATASIVPQPPTVLMSTIYITYALYYCHKHNKPRQALRSVMSP